MTTLGQFICKSTMAQWLSLINRRSLLTHIRLMSSHTGLQLFQMQSQLLSGENGHPAGLDSSVSVTK